jgi:hypothetical protein
LNYLKSRAQTAFGPRKPLNFLSFPETGTRGRLSGLDGGPYLDQNLGPHHGALWILSDSNIQLWETEFCAQRLSREFGGIILELQGSLVQRQYQRARPIEITRTPGAREIRLISQE